MLMSRRWRSQHRRSPHSCFGLWLHNEVRDSLYSLLLDTMPGCTVLKEKHIAHGDNPIIADIVVVDGGNRIVIDVTITDPACVTHVDRGNTSSAVVADAGARAAEATKRAKYASVPQLHCDPDCFDDSGVTHDFVFVPFAMEATGRLGPAATDFLDNFILLNPIFHADVSQFRNNLDASVARNNSRMITKNRRNVVFNDTDPAPNTNSSSS